MNNIHIDSYDQQSCTASYAVSCILTAVLRQGHLRDCAPGVHQRNRVVLKLTIVTRTARVPVNVSFPLSQPSPQYRGKLADQKIITGAELAFADHRAAGAIREARVTIVLATQAYTSIHSP